VDWLITLYILISSSSLGIIAGVGGVIALSIIFYFFSLYLKKKINPFKSAVKYYNRENLNKALLFLAIELENNSSNKEAFLLKADIEAQSGFYDEAVKDYFRLLHFKQAGDGIDVFEVKKRLLNPLYLQESLLELHTLCKEILFIEPNNPEALYYLALLYIGQLYYREASSVLKKLVSNRPRMHNALFAYAVCLVQDKKFDRALAHINSAIELSDCYLYQLTASAVNYLQENYSEALDISASIPQKEKAFENRRQYLFAMKLKAVCNYMQGRYKKASGIFRLLYNTRCKEKDQKDTGQYQEESLATATLLYNEYGRVKQTVQNDIKKGEQGSDSVFRDYYKLKEVAVEEGKISMLRTPPSLNRILDIEGFSTETLAAVDLGFSMVKAGLLKDSCDFLQKVCLEHPEVLGLKKVIALIEERQKVMSAGEKGSVKSGTYEEESTQSVIRRKNRKYELRDYMDKWEKSVIKPYQLIIAAGFTSKKQLSPVVMFGNRGRG